MISFPRFFFLLYCNSLFLLDLLCGKPVRFFMVKKFSGIQKEVLTLYRSCLRAVYEKPKVCIHSTHYP